MPGGEGVVWPVIGSMIVSLLRRKEARVGRTKPVREPFHVSWCAVEVLAGAGVEDASPTLRAVLS